MALEQNLAHPRSLTSADFDEDGVPDLICAYEYQQRGIATLQRGNIDALYSNSAPAQLRTPGISTPQNSDKRESDSAFFAAADVFPLPTAPDFIGTGDFNADGHQDIVVATNGGNKLSFLLGDGQGHFDAARGISVGGSVTSFATGDINRADGLTDIVVGVLSEGGAHVLVFESPEGAMRAVPERFALPARVTALALARLAGGPESDLVVASGTSLVIIAGRDRKLSINISEQGKVAPAEVVRRTMPYSVSKLTAGDFIWDKAHQTDLALLAADGVVHFLSADAGLGSLESSTARVGKLAVSWREQRSVRVLGPSLRIQSAPPNGSVLMAAHLSARQTDDLLFFAAAQSQVQVINADPGARDETGILLRLSDATEPTVAALSASALPLAVLPMRLSAAASDGLVVMRGGQVGPTVIAPSSGAIITVNSSDDTNIRDNLLTLREAILLSNGGTSASGGLSKAELTSAERAQVQGTPGANQLDEIRFNIPPISQGSAPAFMNGAAATTSEAEQDNESQRSQPLNGSTPVYPARRSPTVDRRVLGLRVRTPLDPETPKEFCRWYPDEWPPQSIRSSATNSPPVPTFFQRPAADSRPLSQPSIRPTQATQIASPDVFSCSTPAFGPLNTIVVGNGGFNPYSVAVADFNRDGKLDLVTANQESDNVTVRLGNGAGGFGPPNSFSLGAGPIRPISVAVGDLNGDGSPDVVTSNSIANNVTVLLGNGAGSFGPARPFGLGGVVDPGSVALDDLNRDGRLDVVTANRISNSITVLLGNGSGGFGIPNSLSLGAGANIPFAIATGDFNLDLKVDVVTANYDTNNITVFLGNGAGGFGPPNTINMGGSFGKPYSVAVGDLNGDRKPDLVVADASSLSTIKVLLGNGTGGFSVPDTFGLGGANNPFSVAIGDFNGDSKPDVVAASISDNVTLVLGNGAGAFGPPNTFYIGVNSGFPLSVAIGDFNGDGKRDVVTANSNTDNVSLLLGNGGGGFGVASIFDLGATANFPIAGASADLNGDGRADVVTANFGSSNISVLLANASGGFGAPNTIGLADGLDPRSVAFGDFNLDGKLDIVTANSNSRNIALLLGNGFGGFGIAHTFTLGGPKIIDSESLAVADFNRDGKLDVVAVGYSNNITVLLGDGAGGFGGPTLFDLGPLFSTLFVAVGDFNGDAKVDVVTANREASSITVMLGNGAGGFGPPNTMSLGSGIDPVSVAVADFNVDGRPDLVTTNFNSNSLSILFGNGAGGFGPPNLISIGAEASHPVFVTVSDFNGDGKLDLLTSNLYSSNISVFLGNGNGSFGFPKTFSLGGDALPYFVAVGDFNMDGRPDLMTAAADGNSVAFLLNACGTTGMAPDLTLSKSHVGNLTVGSEGVFQLTVTNVGTISTSSAITLTDNLPAGLSFAGISYYPLDGRWNCGLSGQTVTCTNPLLLPPNTSSSVNLFVDVAPAAVPAVTNNATVAVTGDNNAANNTANDFTLVGGSCAAQPVSIGQVVNGALTSTDCYSPLSPNSPRADRYTFTGASGQPIAITLSSSNFDTFLYFIGPSGTVIGSDDDGGGGTNSRILAGSGFFILPANGTYTIEVTSARTNETGNYTLSLATGTPTCTYNIAPTAQAFNGAGGTATVAVTTPSNCQWTASSNSSFIIVNSGENGTGNGAVTFTVAANSTSSSRIGTLTIAGQTFTVSQAAGSSCVYNINPMSQSFQAVGGSGSASVVAPNGCAWTATSNASFIIVNGGNGNGNGIASFTVTANTSFATRTGTLTIAGQTFTVVQGGATTNTFTINLASPLPKITDSVIIDGSTQPGFSGTPLIVINGAGLASAGGGNGLVITAGSSTVRGLTLTGFASGNRDAALLLITNGGNVVEGCYVGTDASGTRSSGQVGGAVPLAAGIDLRSSTGNRIGGTTATARNIISGIDGSGVIITGASTNNLIQGNYIGTDVTGSLSLGRQHVGVYIQGANGNTIGGQTAIPGTPPGNLISGNIDYGVFLQDDSSNNLIVGNLIGSNGNGTTPVPNGNAGVFISRPGGLGSQLNNTIGGTAPSARNIISGNDPYGIVLGEGATATLVQGNYIGTRIDGAAALPNIYGITATQATGSTIGGALDSARNVISGNTLTGVSIGFLNNGQLGGTGTTIQRNYIGTNAAGTGALGNQADGVFVEVQSITHTIQENLIGFNGNSGVRIPNTTTNPGTPGFRIQIVDNSIFSNSVLGIDLGEAGITPNDPLDADAGANLQQNFPVLISLSLPVSSERNARKRKPTSPAVTLNVNATLNSTPNTTFTVHWYFSSDSQCSNSQQTSRPLASGRIPGVLTDASGNASFSFPFEFPVGTNSGVINCTATDPQGNTSEFSACLPVTAPSPAFVQFAAGSYSVAENAGFATITVTRSGDTAGTCSVNFATSDGTAQQRNDYTIAGGTLTFAPSDTSKTFRVLISDDSYPESNETVNLNLSNANGATVSGPATVTLTINDNDVTTPTMNPLDDTRYFVGQHYYDFLSRVPDQSGLDYWMGQITQCGTNAGCLSSQRITVSNAFFYEQEYQETGSYVVRLYRAAFGNNQPISNSDANPQFPNENKKLVNYSAFSLDRAQVRGGSSLAQTQLELANAFVLRPQFLAKYPGTLNGPAFVDAVVAAINTDIGVNLTPQRSALIDLFNQGGRGKVMYRLADDNASNPVNNRAFIDAEYNRAFVLTQYFGYLRRNPDIGGYVFWLSQVNSAPLRALEKQRAMVCSFVTSAEYQQRFSPVTTHNNTECPQ